MTPASTKPRRLFIDARMLFSSGIGRYLREILRRWPAAIGVDETYLCNAEEQVAWLRQHRPAAGTQNYPGGIYSAREQLGALRLPRHAVFWVPHYNVPFLTPARVVATVHDVAPLALPDIFNRPAQRIAAKLYFGATRWSAHRVITVSQFSADELQRRVSLPPERVTVIHNGVDPAWFQFPEGNARHANRVLFIGNLKPHKNLARLVEALQRVRQGGVDVELDVVGQVEGFRTGLEAGVAATLRSTPWIQVHGAVSDAMLQTFYARATALVFPSIYEGFGLPLLEAMAAGCPVVAARATSLPEIGGEAHRVFYFDPHSVEDIAATLQAFLRLPLAERLAAGEAGRDRAKHFSWENSAARTLAVLQEACAS